MRKEAKKKLNSRALVPYFSMYTWSLLPSPSVMENSSKVHCKDIKSAQSGFRIYSKERMYKASTRTIVRSACPDAVKFSYLSASSSRPSLD